MHRHLNPQQWALAFGDPDDPHGVQLYGCPRCAVARGDLEAWILSVAECPLCWPAFDAYEPVPPDALDCEQCLAAYDEFETWLERLEHFEPLVAPEWTRAGDLLKQLEGQSVEEQLRLVRTEPGLASWGLCQRLLEQSRKSWVVDPLHARSLAEVAAEVSDRLSSETYHPRWVADLRAKAHAYLANTCRSTGDLRAAEVEFAQAERHVERGVGAGRAEMVVLDLKASLLLDQHRYLEADALLDRVERHFRDLENEDRLARVLIKRALVSISRDLPKQAVRQIDDALAILDPEAEPVLYQAALHNRTRYLLEGGRVEEARESFDGLPDTEDRHIRYRRAWLGANLLRTEGNFEAAAKLYDDARIGYLAEGLHFTVALVSLDLAVLARMQADHDTVRELARDALVLLTRAGAPREAFAAIRLLVDAVEQQAVSTAFIQQVARNLSRVQGNK